MWDYAMRALGTFLALAGLLGTVVQLLTTTGPLRNAGFLILFVLLILVGVWLAGYNVWLRRKANKGLPDMEAMERISASYSVEPATSDEVHWVATLEASVYPPQDAIPEAILREWYNANPNAFFIIRSRSGELVGHLDVLPLRPATMQAFLAGDIVERQIRGDSLYSVAEKGKVRDVYVESIVLAPSQGASSVSAALLSVLGRFGSVLERVCDLENLEHVYAIAASSKGEKLMKGLGFAEMKAADSRADHHKLFGVDFLTLAQKIAALLGDHLKDPDLIGKILKARDKAALPGL
ncbi:MAG: hypothetical protein QOH06_1975 [Acidobacteriota bacterium]|nr:hypothetical protein [Acidobacteriota bacterium]